MIVIHEVEPAALEDVLREGLKRTSRGANGKDQAIIATDKLLDRLKPIELRRAGVSRDKNLYAYMLEQGSVIDIRDASLIPIENFVGASDKKFLRFDTDPSRSFVSDLDRYDRVKKAVQNSADTAELHKLAKEYWDAVRLLAEYVPGSIRRPEVMVTYDIPPNAVEIVN